MSLSPHESEGSSRSAPPAHASAGTPKKTLPTLGRLESLPALDHPELLAPSVVAALEAWEHGPELAVVAIDPAVADTAAMSEAYDLGMDTGANCVVVGGRRDGEERIAACLVRADTRADVNNVVKRTLDVRKASFLSMDRAVEDSGMEYGGITPVGLPAQWRLLVDPRVLDIEVAVIGSGTRRSKLLIPGPLAGRLPGAEVIDGLAG
jgi:prolyl-tRNA editing enzyme YbaK/EbsC (Cys-tRNA(Pro) deacylase)